MVRLRTGGARLQDQLLAADKAGQWSEALALYEQVKVPGLVPVSFINRFPLASLQPYVIVRPYVCAPFTLSKPGVSRFFAPVKSPVCAMWAQELQDATPGTQFCLKSAHLGHLRCLLHMGHIKNMLAEVDGWAAQCSGEAIKGPSSMSLRYFAAPLVNTVDDTHPCAGTEHQEISSWGVAGAWRIGDWGLLHKYLKNAKTGPRTGKDSEDQWEVCIGSLIAAVHDRCAGFTMSPTRDTVG